MKFEIRKDATKHIKASFRPCRESVFFFKLKQHTLPNKFLLRHYDLLTTLMGRMSRSPAGATVSIRFDGSRWFRARHQEHGASAPMCRAKRGRSRRCTAAVLSGRDTTCMLESLLLIQVLFYMLTYI